MKKLKFLIQYGLKKRVFKKSFLISNIIIGIITMIIINIPNIIQIFNQDENTQYVIQFVLDENTEAIYDNFDLINQSFETEYVIKQRVDSFDESSFYEQNTIDMTIILSKEENVLSISLYRFKTDMDGLVVQTIQYLDNILQNPNYQVPQVQTFLPDSYQDPIISEIVSSLSILFVLPLFMIMVFGIQFVGVDIIEEKSSKAIETIISSVPANIHFLSKIISSMLFITIQSVLLLMFGLIGQWISQLLSNVEQSLEGVPSVTELVAQYFPDWQSIVLFSVLFIIVGSIFYLVIAAVIASASTTQEDYQQFQSPMMLILVAGFYIAIFASAAGANTLLRIVSFIPIFSPLVVPVAYAVGAISILDMVIALIITILFTWIMITLITPIYKVAILSYDQTKFITRIKNYLKKSKYTK